MISAVFECNEPETIEEKKKLLLENGTALWDAIASCKITASSDSSIRNVKVNNISKILEEADIRQIFVNGRTAEKYFKKYTKVQINRDVVCLPSASPANASWTVKHLAEKWEVIKNI